MKSKRRYPIITVTPKAEKFIKSGHVWVYGQEIAGKFGEYENGALVDVVTQKGRYLGTGYINDNSKITVRIISKNPNDKFDNAFYERRIRYCIDYRKTVMGDDFNCCRLIFGEADGFPGLTADLFGDIVVTQVLSLGTEKVKNIIFPILVKALKENGIHVKAIFERNDVSIRQKEGLEQYKAFYELEGLHTDLDGKTVITENGIKYNIDYINGQKTGFFLDQKYNRLAVGKIAKDKNVLDCFTHTGAFALNCAAAGAKHVTAVDVSKEAICLTEENAKLNDFKNISFECANVFDFLTELHENGKKPYDLIIKGNSLI